MEIFFVIVKASTTYLRAVWPFSGVGRKVADCICLYGLNHMASWPVDTHILQYALNDKAFLSFLKKRSGSKSLRGNVLH